MSDDEADVFNGELPNFDAFRATVRDGSPSREKVIAWADQMEKWAKGALAEIADTETKLQGEIEESDTRIAKLEEELAVARSAADDLEDLRDRILDMDRGLVTPGELHLEVRSLG